MGVKIVQVSMTDNPHLSNSAIETFLSRLSPEERAAREHGQFVVMGGLIFPEFTFEKHVIKPLLQPNKNNLWVCSVDSGFNNPTCWLWAMFDNKGKCVVFDEHYEREKTVEYHAQVVHERNRLFERRPDFYTGDPAIQQKRESTGTSVHEEYARRGIAITPSNNDVVPGINRIHEYLNPALLDFGNQTLEREPMLQITSNCVNLLNEMQKYRWATYSKRVARDKALQEKPHKKDDHAVDSLRYLLMSRPAFKPLGRDIVQQFKESEMAGARMAGIDYDERLLRERAGVGPTRWTGAEDIMEWE